MTIPCISRPCHLLHNSLAECVVAWQGSTLQNTEGARGEYNKKVSGASCAQQGSTTHCVNTDQRRIPLTPMTVGPNSYLLALPTDPGIILPGMWWLFAIDPVGVPSVGFQMLVRAQAVAVLSRDFKDADPCGTSMC